MSKKPTTVMFGSCKECGEHFAKRRKDQECCSDKCRFQFWNKRRMDFRGTNQKIDQLNRKLDIIIERLPEKAAGIKEGGK